jgi:predicted nucleotidyltransferase
MNTIITDNIDKIESLCRKYKVKELYVFGSVTGKKFSKKSDVDLLVNFKSIPVLDYADNYFSLLDALQKILKRNIDLLTLKSLRNPYFIEEVNETKKKIYEA